jgi:RimJ/RimL family protein N-acetyltransferase
MERTTERLRLESIDPATAARIVAGTPGPDDRWHPEYPVADELDPLAALASTADPDPVFTLYRVVERASGLAVGGLGFFGPPDEAGAVELGYGLVAAVRGRGYATEALRAAVALAHEHGVRLLRADTEPANTASVRVLEKAGFREVGVRDGLRLFEFRP